MSNANTFSRPTAVDLFSWFPTPRVSEFVAITDPDDRFILSDPASEQAAAPGTTIDPSDAALNNQTYLDRGVK